MPLLVALILALFISNVVVCGQGKEASPAWAALDGTWTMDSKGVAKVLGRPLEKDLVWVIKSTPDIIKIEMSLYVYRINHFVTFATENVSLSLDPRRGGETNLVRFGSDMINVVSKTKWSKQKLSREYRTSLALPPGSSTDNWIEDVTEKLSLSKDGRTLIFEASGIGNQPNDGRDLRTVRPIRLVLNRKQ